MSLHDDIADVARRVIVSMHKDGQPLDVDEIQDAVIHTFKNHHLDDDTRRRLRVFIERWIARVTTQP